MGDRGTLGTLRRLGVPWGPNATLVEALQRQGCCVVGLRWLWVPASKAGQGR